MGVMRGSRDGKMAPEVRSMTITLGSETQKLLEEQMKRAGTTSPEEVVRIALEHLRISEVLDYDDLDAATQASIARAQAEFDRGEGMPVEGAFAALKRKHVGQ
jgi:hypothetical protein